MEYTSDDRNISELHSHGCKKSSIIFLTFSQTISAFTTVWWNGNYPDSSYDIEYRRVWKHCQPFDKALNEATSPPSEGEFRQEMQLPYKWPPLEGGLQSDSAAESSLL